MVEMSRDTSLDPRAIFLVLSATTVSQAGATHTLSLSSVVQSMLPHILSTSSTDGQIPPGHGRITWVLFTLLLQHRLVAQSPVLPV
jgi:hypothetical protein